MKHILSVAALVAVSCLQACGARASDPGTDSSTHFWGRCEQDNECSSGSCVCGRCTSECADDHDCSPYSRKAVCASAASIEGCGAVESQILCAPEAEVTQSPELDAGPATASETTTLSAAGVKDAGGPASDPQTVREPEAPSTDAAAAPVSSAPSNWDGGWVPRELGFLELALNELDGIEYVTSAKVDAAGNLYLLAIVQETDGLTQTSALVRLDPDGRLGWLDRYSGTASSLAVDAVGFVYQARTVNNMGLVDRYTPEGDWIWSKELYSYPEDLRVLVGNDDVAYATHSRDNYLWKIDVDGQELWRWQADTSERIANVAVSEAGTVHAEFPVTPQVPPDVALSKGEYPPMDQMFYTLDASGNLASERRYELAFDLTSTGPRGFVTAKDGNLLSAEYERVRLFDTGGEVLWESAGSANATYYTALSRGRCEYCAYNNRTLYAFDAEGRMFESVTLPDEHSANYWSVDEADNVYAFLWEEGSTFIPRVIKFPKGAGWQPTPTSLDAGL